MLSLQQSCFSLYALVTHPGRAIDCILYVVDSSTDSRKAKSILYSDLFSPINNFASSAINSLSTAVIRTQHLLSY